MCLLIRLMRMRDIGMRGGKARAGLRVGLRTVGGVAIAVVFARCLGGLDAVARLDHVGLEGDGTRTAVQFEEETAGVAEDGA
jgi:hypothetical protein